MTWINLINSELNNYALALGICNLGKTVHGSSWGERGHPQTSFTLPVSPSINVGHPRQAAENTGVTQHCAGSANDTAWTSKCSNTFSKDSSMIIIDNVFS